MAGASGRFVSKEPRRFFRRGALKCRDARERERERERVDTHERNDTYLRGQHVVRLPRCRVVVAIGS